MKEQDMGASPDGDRATRPTAQAPAGLGDSASVPSAAVRAAWDRLHKFAVEWKFMELKSGYGGNVFELHPGDARHAVCRIADIITLLEAVDG